MSATYRIEWTDDGQPMAVEAPTKAKAVTLYEELADKGTAKPEFGMPFGTSNSPLGLIDTTSGDSFSIDTDSDELSTELLRMEKRRNDRLRRELGRRGP